MGVDVVGFLGLGNMGIGLASNLQRFLKEQGTDAKFYGKLHIWNRTTAKAAPLQELGASLNPSVADLARVCNICFAMLFDDAALESTFNDYLKTAQTGTVFINCATVDPALASKLAERGRSRSCAFLSSPVFGRPDAAAAQQCLVVASGAAAAMEQVRPLLQAMGRGVIELGADPAAAAAVKLIGNFLVVSQVELLAEALNLGDRSGVPRDVVVSIVEKLFPGAIIPGYAKRLAADAFDMSKDPGFSVTGGLTVVRLMLALGERCGAALPAAKLACGHLEAVEAEGMGGLDLGALALAVRKEAPR
ncbi:hypothetical protein WJX81_004942 [Elliptochloris bilobata]|uniref:6-phosphogluconate dehydrogenase NADP-binding domain-containing protein n=1 Tax=Elliptochloris bilobata TaxID=381761 RepID=A0AAW1SHU5_9CHLO